jgi:acyl-coenzyme A synthetase/AMP-(fatty) acid ligase
MNPLVTTQFIKHWAQNTPKNTAITWGNKNYSYYWTAVSIIKFATFLQSHGIHKGTTVAIKIQHRVVELVIILAAECLGAVRIAQIEDSKLTKKCDFYISDKEPHDPALKTLHLTPSLLDSILLKQDNDVDWERLDFTPLPDDLIFISHTSGTTGNKKYFAESHSSMWANLELMKNIYFANKEDTFLSMNSLAVSAAYVGCCLAFICGGKVVFSCVEELALVLDSNPRSHAALVLKDAIRIYENAANLKPTNKISTLRILGAALPNDLREWLESHIANQVFNSYSSNETGQIGEVLANGITKIYNGVKVKIVNENWEELALNKTGLIAVNSEQIVLGYIWDEKLNAIHFKDGWYRTNDMGYLQNAQELVVLDRADNMLNFIGIKIPPVPIENLLKKISGIKEVILYTPSASIECSVVAFVVAAIDANQTAISEAITEVLQRNLKFKFRVNISTIFFDQFPRTETGKIQRFKLIAAMASK